MSYRYATRVKAITNNAQRNVDSKEISQLREVRTWSKSTFFIGHHTFISYLLSFFTSQVILKLKSGQPVEEDIYTSIN